MKNLIRNLALGLTLSLPSLASAQLGTSWLDAPNGGPQRALEVAADGGTTAKGWMRVGGGYMSLQTTNTTADVNLVCKGSGPNDQLTLTWSQWGFSSIQSGIWGANPRPLCLQGGGGDVGIGTQTPLAKLDVNGTTRTKALELTGGADIAEMFRSVEPLEPGTVVVADEIHESQVRAAASACDEAAIGIVSGAGGIQPAQTLRQEGTLADGNLPVSTGGRVWCKCDASFGVIKPGTLLTTSTTPGHAMKVTDKARAQGAIIGKALTSLKEGQGLVLVWVTHQ